MGSKDFGKFLIKVWIFFDMYKWVLCVVGLVVRGVYFEFFVDYQFFVYSFYSFFWKVSMI